MPVGDIVHHEPVRIKSILNERCRIRWRGSVRTFLPTKERGSNSIRRGWFAVFGEDVGAQSPDESVVLTDPKDLADACESEWTLQDPRRTSSVEKKDVSLAEHVVRAMIANIKC